MGLWRQTVATPPIIASSKGRITKYNQLNKNNIIFKFIIQHKARKATLIKVGGKGS